MVRPYTLHEPFLNGEASADVDYFDPIQAFAKKRYVRLAGRIISQLQRIPCSGIFSDETKGMKSVWDEWCWYQAHYDNDCGALSSAFEDTLSSMILAILQEVEPDEAVLLTCAAAEEQDCMPYRSDEVMAAVLHDMVTEAAGMRSVSRFEVY
jgi:hypothetical protein